MFIFCVYILKNKTVAYFLAFHNCCTWWLLCYNYPYFHVNVGSFFCFFLNFFTLFLYFLEVVRKISFNCSFIAIGVYFLRWNFSLFLFGKVLKMNINQRFLFFVFLVNFTFVFISYHWGLFIFCFSANTC